MRINFIKEKNKPLHADNIRLGGYGEPIQSIETRKTEC
ncbi:hypothetical protein KPP56652_46 [Klebsiella phage KPP5665-2]|nr:hypothetical protein KPP56652_46 [Klebsiella phage KPP5665-2]